MQHLNIEVTNCASSLNSTKEASGTGRTLRTKLLHLFSIVGEVGLLVQARIGCSGNSSTSNHPAAALHLRAQAWQGFAQVVCTAIEVSCERAAPGDPVSGLCSHTRNQSWHSRHLCSTGTLQEHELAKNARGSTASTLQEGLGDLLCVASIGTEQTLIEM